MWKRRLWGVILPLLLVVLACGFQTVVWTMILGNLPAPPVWLLVVAWLSLYRPQSSTILLVYAAGWFASAFSALPLKMMLFSLLITHVVLVMTRQRVFWSGVSYFILAAMGATAIFHLADIGLSFLLEPVHAAVLPFERLTQVLLAVPFGFLVYSVMTRLDPPVTLENRSTEGIVT